MDGIMGTAGDGSKAEQIHSSSLKFLLKRHFSFLLGKITYLYIRIRKSVLLLSNAQIRILSYGSAVPLQTLATMDCHISLYLLSFAIFVQLYFHLLLFLLFHPYTSPFVFLLLYNLPGILPVKPKSSIFPLLITCPTNLICLALIFTSNSLSLPNLLGTSSSIFCLSKILSKAFANTTLAKAFENTLDFSKRLLNYFFFLFNRVIHFTLPMQHSVHGVVNPTLTYSPLSPSSNHHWLPH